MQKRQLAPKVLLLLAAVAAITGVTVLSAVGATKPSVGFTTPPRTTTAGLSSETITVSLPSGLSGPASVKLSSSSSTGTFRNADDTATVTSLNIAGGGTEASFRYRDAKAGKATITATAASTARPKQWNGNIAGSQTETIVPATLHHLGLSPSSATVASGVRQTYEATGFDSFDNSLGDVTGQTTFTIAPDGNCQGASCQAVLAGTHTVTGTNGGATGKATLTVTPGPLARIEVSPESATISSGSSQAFSVIGYDAAGNEIGDVTAQTSFGISPDGSCAGATCTASQAGEHVVTASSGSLSDQATLNVESAAQTTVSLTFDDGRADQIQAAHLLSERGMEGTFFVITGRIGAAGYLSLAELEEMSAAGHEIGDHTVNHLNLLNVNREEAERQVCNARAQLETWGFEVRSFAYPQGGSNPEIEEVVENCNLNSARIASDLVSPGACSGCAYAETIPPKDPYKIRTPDSVKSDTTLEELKGLVTQAQEHGGGWVPVVFHRVCDECSVASIDPATLAAFLDWLGSEASNGVSVKTVDEVIGGEDKPVVSAPPAPPRTGDLLENPSLEADQNANGVPDCWTIGASGTNELEATRTTDSHTGLYAERVAISSFTEGDRRLMVTPDLGQCAPPASPTHTYTASAFLKGEGTMRWVAYLRNDQGAWSFWAQGPLLSVGGLYAETSWTTPQVPSWATAISVAISLRSVGSFTADDFFLEDNGASDQTPPVVQLTAPPNGTTVEGTTNITAEATDNVGIASVRFFLDGVSLGSKTTPTVSGGSVYQWKWDTTAVSEGPHTLTAVATDTDGNQTTSAPISVAVARTDTTAPSAKIINPANNSTVTGTVFIQAEATDNVGIASVRFFLDGVSLGSKTTPTVSGGSVYQWKWETGAVTKGPHTLSAVATDAAGNKTTAEPVSVTVG